EASRAKWTPIAQWAAEFRKAEKEAKATNTDGENSALRWRRAIKDADAVPDGDDEFPESERDTLISLAVDDAERMAEAVGDEKAKQWFDLATAVDTPTLREAWRQWEA